MVFPSMLVAVVVNGSSTRPGCMGIINFDLLVALLPLITRKEEGFSLKRVDGVNHEGE